MRARVDTERWRIAGRDVDCTIDMGVRGEIALPDREAPEALLTGEGSIDLFGAHVEGRGGVELSGTQLTTFAEGSLHWHGREWLSGRVTISTGTVTLSGHVAVGLALTPENLVGVELANLWFTLDMHASLTLRATGGLQHVRIDGRWALGARAAGTDQLFPLAAQQIHVDESTLDVELISIDGFSLLPMGGLDGLTLPVPVFRPVPPKVKLGHLFLVPGFQYGDIKLGANLEDANAVEVAEIPVMFDKQKEELTLSFGLGSKFASGLAWIGGRLSLKVSRTGRSTKSIPI